MESEHSITFYIQGLKDDDSEAKNQIWNHYVDRLLRLARGKLPPGRVAIADEDDVANSVYRRLLDGVDKRQFTELEDRDDLWQILIMLTERKAIAIQRYELAQKRDVRKRVAQHDDSNGKTLNSQAAQASCPEPTPEMAAILNEQLTLRIEKLGDEVLRTVAQMKLEGYNYREIAEVTKLSERSVQRKIVLIRRRFEDAKSDLETELSAKYGIQDDSGQGDGG